MNPIFLTHLVANRIHPPVRRTRMGRCVRWLKALSNCPLWSATGLRAAIRGFLYRSNPAGDLGKVLAAKAVGKGWQESRGHTGASTPCAGLDLTKRTGNRLARELNFYSADPSPAFRVVPPPTNGEVGHPTSSPAAESTAASIPAQASCGSTPSSPTPAGQGCGHISVVGSSAPTASALAPAEN